MWTWILAASLAVNAALIGRLLWRHRKRFRYPRRSVPAARHCRVLIAGDSRAEMWDVARWFPGLGFENVGQAGTTTHEVLESVGAALGQVEPEIVVVLAGINDFDVGGKMGLPMNETVRMVLDNLREIIHEIRQAGARAVVATVPPLHGQVPDIRHARTPADRVWALNERIVRLAGHHHAAVFDLARILADGNGALDPACTSDGLHFNDVGYERATAGLLSRLDSLDRGRSGAARAGA